MMQQLDATFSALADGTRRAIVARLADGEASVSELAQPFAMSLTAVSKHIRVLKEAGLVQVEKRGRTRHCRLEPAPMKDVSDWIGSYQKFWTERFDALADYLASEAEKK